MSISLNLKNGSVQQHIAGDENYSEFLHTKNDTKASVACGVETVESEDNSYVDFRAKKISHNGREIHTPEYIPSEWDGSYPLYGYIINQDTSDPNLAVSYVPGCSNEHYIPARMYFADDNTSEKFDYGSWKNAFFIPKPCILDKNGTVNCYLNPNNYFEDIEGNDVTALVNGNTDNGQNVMVEFPQIFIYQFMYGNSIICFVAPQKVNDKFECWSCKHIDGYYNHLYLSAYEGYYKNDVMRSLSVAAKPQASDTTENEYNKAIANGSGYEIWHWADWVMIQAIFVLMFKGRDSEGLLGAGATSSTSALTLNCAGEEDKGLFWGTKEFSSTGMKCFGIRNLWAHRWNRVLGLCNSNNKYFVKMTKDTSDGTSRNDWQITNYTNTVTGYHVINHPSLTNGSCIQRMGNYNNGDLSFGLLPSDNTDSNYDIYYTDNMWISNNTLSLVGGSVNNGRKVGPLYA